MRGETVIEKHLRLQKQADELVEKIDFNVGSDAGREALREPRLVEALQQLMESKQQAGPYQE